MGFFLSSYTEAPIDKTRPLWAFSFAPIPIRPPISQMRSLCPLGDLDQNY